MQRNANTQSIANVAGFQCPTYANETETIVKPITAVFPTINAEATRLTMDAYRLFVDNYNRQIEAENEAIREYNKFQAKEPTGTIEKDSLYAFKLKHGIFFTKNGSTTWKRSTRYSTRKYNELVANYNGFWEKKYFKKEELQPIRTATEAVFRQILYAYSLQLLKHTAALQKFNIKAKTEIDGVLVNSFAVANAQRNGIGIMNYCTKTIRNHCKRLEEAGILKNRRYISRIKGVEFEICGEILHIFDQKDKKIITAENQSLTGGKRKKLPQLYYDSLQEQKNKEEIKENVHNNSQNSEFATAHSASTLEVSSEKKEFATAHGAKKVQEQTLQEQREQVADCGTKNAGAPPKNSRSLPRKGQKSAPKRRITPEIGKLSQMLTARIEDVPQFCKDLANGNYNNYKPLDLRILVREAYNGIMSREDFHDLIIQEFLKQSAKIWKGKNANTGTWVNTYKLLKNNYFIGANGKSVHKYYQVELLGEYRWRIDHARKYFLRHKDFNPLYPSQYFDRTRKTHQEGGFEWTKKAWQKHLKYTQEKDARKHSALRKAELRKQKRNAHKAITWELKKYISEKCTLEELYEFVNTKYPQYTPHIGDMLTNLLMKNN